MHTQKRLKKSAVLAYLNICGNAHTPDNQIWVNTGYHECTQRGDCRHQVQPMVNSLVCKMGAKGLEAVYHYQQETLRTRSTLWHVECATSGDHRVCKIGAHGSKVVYHYRQENL